ncbi:MAG: hypothetical protein GY718_10090 [Lentisphaerae bacterium]|nr:hypothetical protein [Lentisphaerota bacterium]
MKLVKVKTHQEPGIYKPTTLDAEKANADILIQYVDSEAYTIKVQGSVVLGKQGIKQDYGNGLYDITSRKLDKLQQKYNVMADF